MKYFLIFFTSLFYFTNSFGLNPTQLFNDANNSYSKNNFDEAIVNYEKIVSDGYESPNLYYNLANAYFKTDKIALSILNYERAKKLSPTNDDINTNLKFAYKRTIDKIEPPTTLFIDEWWANFTTNHTEKAWSICSIVFFTLFLVAFILFIISKKTIGKQIGFWLFIIFFITSAIFFVVAQTSYSQSMNHSSAIILNSSVEVKNAPSENAIKLFLLHEGTKVTFQESNTDWIKIELTSDKVGWVKKSQLAFI